MSSNIWQTQEWKNKAQAFVTGKSCVWCGTTQNLVPHHPHKKGGYTREEYLSLEGCIVLCSKCNFMENKNTATSIGYACVVGGWQTTPIGIKGAKYHR